MAGCLYHWVESYRKRIIYIYNFFFLLHLHRFSPVFNDSSYFPGSPRMRMEGTSLGAGSVQAMGYDTKVRGLPDGEHPAYEMGAFKRTVLKK